MRTATGALATLEISIIFEAHRSSAQFVIIHATHIEQPGSRHSKPALVNFIRPSCSACDFTKLNPAHTS
jgi:hypothetical protein